ncbi:GNAT family N-acetyltransferase [Oceanirhabdus sp. W0125-5]|uniref:GNAT family N-acetyltransferase n=1 Tax=Oceanirhabdus sp. W0125-5 TaxID=2999116 RepID=UPI0022F2C141|nr:GNAT family N-acetyltransferase [Oceanirhabdus sp. W0125-5]WBW98107.1 GNAT family N-acetyltransferase [Oceanirhabdus sp. W0125-5]
MMDGKIIEFLKMTEDEFKEFSSYEKESYAKELHKVFNAPLEEAYDKSNKTFETYLSNGLNSENNYLYSITETKNNTKVGTLWFLTRDNNGIKELLIASIRIFDEYQGKGYGKKAMSLIDNKALELDVDKIVLHVFGYNKTAISLYEKAGFEPFSVNMEKILK